MSEKEQAYTCDKGHRQFDDGRDKLGGIHWLKMSHQAAPSVERTSSGTDARILRLDAGGPRTLGDEMPSGDHRSELVQLHRDFAGLSGQVEAMRTELTRMADAKTDHASTMGSLQNSMEHILRTMDEVRSSQRQLEATGLPVRVQAIEEKLKDIEDELDAVSGRPSRRLAAPVAAGGAGITIGGLLQWFLQSLSGQP